MEISYDPRKDARNVAVRGLSFDLVKLMDFDDALVKVDDRTDYGEVAISPCQRFAVAYSSWFSRQLQWAFA